MNRVRVSRQSVPVVATLVTFVFLVLLGGFRYRGFFSAGVLLNLFGDGAFLGMAAIGMTFVILSGGIDLSVGSVIGLTSVVSAVLVQNRHWPPGVAIPFVLGMGAGFGAAMGILIRVFELAPFLVTLAGMFLARGVALNVSLESIQLDHPFYLWASGFNLPLGGGARLSFVALAFLALLVVAMLIAAWTRFGRNVYAIGGNAQSAALMGLPVGATQVGIYALSGFCAAIAGVAFTIYTSSGNATAAAGLELDAIAAVVIGGTLLTGGMGSVFGTLLGVLILGLIQTIITFENLSSWWTKIAVGGLLFVFILIQRGITGRARRV